MVEVRKRENESNESLLRRFTRQVQQSRVLIRAKRVRFYEAPKNKREIRESARRRQRIQTEREYQRKIGKLDEVNDRKTRWQAR